ncbi:MarC family protein [Shewanella marina]|uniref:MarC family protein n=1 Tax=Shewanella marina TaxID=487319 RepID=UPI000472B588|nr:MarC family protein [Shewanella marina]
MTEILQHAITVFLGYFAIMNPVANTAVFVGLTANMPDLRRRQTAYKALFTSFMIVLVFALLGNMIFHLFGITLPALRIAGGILVFMIGYQMLHGESSKMHEADDDANSGDIAISPLAVPLLAGPGTIATSMNFAAESGWYMPIITVAMFACLCIITWFCFIFGPNIIRIIGDNGLNIVTRLMGLILAVIGCQMVIDGATTVFH